MDLDEARSRVRLSWWTQRVTPFAVDYAGPAAG
jgi:hypothetical protein